MSNFKNAFNEGMKHAEEAAENNKEIDEVFAELKDELLSLSGGKIELQIKQKFEPQGDSYFARALAEAAAFSGAKGRYYNAIVAVNIKSITKSEAELCEWKLSEKGYPVSISFSSKSQSSADKQSLINSLQEMLSYPSTGKKLRGLLLLEDKSPTSPNQGQKP